MTYHSWGDHFIENELLDIDVYIEPHKGFYVEKTTESDSSMLKPNLTHLYRFHECLISKKSYHDDFELSRHDWKRNLDAYNSK